MKIIFFDSKPYDKNFFEIANQKENHTFKFLELKLNKDTASLAKGYDIVCAFVNDTIDKETIDILVDLGIKAITMRCAGYNNVDIKHAFHKKLPILRVPNYSPYAVAEHAMALLLTLNRKIHRAYIRTRDQNFALSGLLGTDLYGKTAGIIGTGKIGQIFINICKGFGMKILAFDLFPRTDLEVEYTTLDNLLRNSDVISLHCPLTPETKHIINRQSLNKMKKHAFIINTSRGALIDAKALIYALKAQKIAGAGLDVYEEESDYFFEDYSDRVIVDDHLARLLSFNNVIITSHQAFFTKEALQKISEITMFNIKQIQNAEFFENEICYRCDQNPQTCQKQKGNNCIN